MQGQEIKFKKLTTGEGRNGWFKQSGIGLYDYGTDDISIHGLTSRGDAVVGFIKLPKENIQDLIDALEKLK